MNTGRFHKAPADISVLIVRSGKEIHPTRDRSRVEGTRMDDERADCLSHIVTLPKVFDRSPSSRAIRHAARLC